VPLNAEFKVVLPAAGNELALGVVDPTHSSQPAPFSLPGHQRDHACGLFDLEMRISGARERAQLLQFYARHAVALSQQKLKKSGFLGVKACQKPKWRFHGKIKIATCGGLSDVASGAG
jgi:hypothetical protein